MSTERKLPPILPQSVRPFTVRLVNGHFVRVPKVEQISVTDTTRPPSTVLPETSPHGDGTFIHRKLRLVNGHFVGGADPGPVPVQIPPAAGATALPLPAEPTRSARAVEPSPDSWAYAFGTQLDPSDSTPKT